MIRNRKPRLLTGEDPRTYRLWKVGIQANAAPYPWSDLERNVTLQATAFRKPIRAEAWLEVNVVTSHGCRSVGRRLHDTWADK